MIGGRLAMLGLFTWTAACNAVAQATPLQCPPLTPRELPSGAAVGEPRSEQTADGVVRTTWGDGRDAVTIFSAFFRMSPDPKAPVPSREAAVRDRPAIILDIGADGPNPIAGFAWNDGTCAWTVHLGPGNGRDDALDYAGRF